MSHGRRSSACTASTNTVPPKILALRRNLDSQTYSAFIEEAEILDSFATMEPPIRYSFRAPFKRFYSAIVLGQLCLLSTVVALVLTIANYNRADEGDRASYVIWLVLSASATFSFMLLTFVFWHRRRKLHVMQNRLRAMQLDAQAHGSQKRLETASAGVPQLRAETDHRHSVLAQRHFDVAEDSVPAGIEPTRRMSVIAANTAGRRRQMSSATGEGCELSLFQTHLSIGSTKDDVADITNSSAAGQSPPPTYMNPLQRPLRRESTTTRLWQDDPTMMDLFNGLAGANSSNKNRSSPSAIRSRPSITSNSTISPTSSPRKRAATIRSRCDPATLQAPPVSNANHRSSTALPSTQQQPQPVNTNSCRTRAASTASSLSPDCGVLLPSFPLPPSHARFSDPSLPLPPGEEDMSSMTVIWKRGEDVVGNGGGQQGGEGQDKHENDSGTKTHSSDTEDGPEAVAVDGGARSNGGGGGFLEPRRYDTTVSARTRAAAAAADDGRRDSHVDDIDREGDDEEGEREAHGGGVDDGGKSYAHRLTLLQTQQQSAPLLPPNDRPSTWCPSTWGTPPPQQQHRHQRRSHTIPADHSRSSSPSLSFPSHTEMHCQPGSIRSSTEELLAPHRPLQSRNHSNSSGYGDNDDGCRKPKNMSSEPGGAWTAPSMRGRSASGSRFIEEMG
ncbi:hypothetical protein DBV05_g5412 [Lasiodiplodia theobromae]|uniref:Uncharacterized protein n=1 Tax=Lasiodiplodia theobromae TaxID=45133 RepID=A0A5N5DDR8_9PEZI|nr:hypothetical protein DBV05_g5412 [Lasiodiplodia theobromae]